MNHRSGPRTSIKRLAASAPMVGGDGGRAIPRSAGVVIRPGPAQDCGGGMVGGPCPAALAGIAVTGSPGRYVR